MRKILLTALVIGLAQIAMAQLNPVSWTFTAKKINATTYEVHAIATMQSGWHLYSQQQPDDAIIQPTTFNFNNNPFLKFDGKMKEIGKMQKYRDEKLGISANQYSQIVSFVQVVKLSKATVKTNITGKVEYQTCDDKKCLPPKTVNFSIPLS